MTNRKKILIFTGNLFDLCVSQNCDLKTALELITESDLKFLNSVGRHLLSHLEDGCDFSNGLFSCEAICFDSIYIAFMHFLEKSGKVKEVITFLKTREQRREKNFQKLLGASLYPIFVIFLTFGGLVFFIFYGKQILPVSEIDFFTIRKKIVWILLGLMIFCFAISILLRKILGEDSLYEAFVAMNFLVQSGVGINTALDYGRLIVGPESKTGKHFESVKQKLEYGVGVKTAFLAVKNKRINKALKFAQKNGEEAFLFEKICNWMEVCNEKKHDLIMSMVEPMFIATTGVFLLLIMVSIVLPIMSNASSFI